MSKSLGIGMIGTGMISHVHVRAAKLAGAKIVGVLGSTAAKSEEYATLWQATAYTTIEDLLSNPEIDVVHVCTPNATHFSFAKLALEAGKHVVCEKPLATSLAQAQELAALAKAKQLIATIPFVYRYHPMVREARAKIQNGELGKLNLIHGSYLQDWLLNQQDTNWRVDNKQGGPSRVFADIGSHWCDLIEWVTGERFVSLVSSFSTVFNQRPVATRATFQAAAEGEETYTDVGTEDIASALLTTSRGTTATLTTSQVSPGRKNRLWFEIDGAKQSVMFDQEEPEKLWVGSRESMQLLVRDPSIGSSEQKRLSMLPSGHAQGYSYCFEAFVADTYATVKGETPDGLPTFEDGVRSAKLIDGMLQSSKTKQWVSFEP